MAAVLKTGASLACERRPSSWSALDDMSFTHEEVARRTVVTGMYGRRRRELTAERRDSA
jgi:hypothetical protein